MIVSIDGSQLICELTEDEVEAANWEQSRGSNRLSKMFTNVMATRVSTMKASNEGSLIKKFNSMSLEDQDAIRGQIDTKCE